VAVVGLLSWVNPAISLTYHTHQGTNPQINDSGQIAFRRGGATNYDVFLAEPDTTSNAYTFKFTYGNDDYCQGTVYAPEGYGYYVGYYSPTFIDENGTSGSYYISAVQTGFDLSKSGEVYVTSCCDQESGNTYTPVGSGAAVATGYLGSEYDYIICSRVPEFYFGSGYYEADVGEYSRYDFKYYCNNGSGDYYVGYIYAPTSFQTSGPNLTVGTNIYDQPMPLWGSYKSLNGAYYSITEITDGYASSCDKQSYITSYYDGNTAKSVLGVNSDGSAIASYVYVADRSTAWETGYAISGSRHAAFIPSCAHRGKIL